MKELLLCRHAKSSWKDSRLADIDRPLNKRGKRDAPMMGRRLAQRGMQPECILSSPAKRARKTASRLCRGLEISTSIIRIDEKIYHADVAGLLGVLTGIEDGLQRVILIGHNNELTDLCNFLLPVNVSKVPTCGILGSRHAVAHWRELSPASAKLLFFDYPKKVRL